MNQYDVLGILGEGAYGIVMKCKDKTSKQIVAIKKFKDKDLNNESIKKVIIRELNSLRNLKHINLINLLKAFKYKRRLYLVFEYMSSTLLDFIEGQQSLSLNQIRSIIKQILEGLNFMHRKKYIHRDIKPENILLDSKFNVKICDFGFTRQKLSQNVALTDYVATRWYRSPELLLLPQYDQKVDIWALGCVILEMVSGEPCFPGDDFIDQIDQICQLLGPLPKSFKKQIISNQEFDNINFQNFFRKKNLNIDLIQFKYYYHFKDKDLIDLVKKMLNMDYNKRITAQQALKHPFFSQDDKENQLVVKKKLKKANYSSQSLNKNNSNQTLKPFKSTIQNIRMMKTMQQSKTVLPKINQYKMRLKNKKKVIQKVEFFKTSKVFQLNNFIIFYLRKQQFLYLRLI